MKSIQVLINTWRKATEKEMASLQSNEIWELVEPPPNRRIIGSKCVFKRKVNADGEVERYKARLVAQGCTQRFSLDYEETFSTVVRFESIRSAIALGAQHKLQLHQMEVSTALLLGCRLGWRCWRQKINLWVPVPSRRCSISWKSSKQTYVALSTA